MMTAQQQPKQNQPEDQTLSLLHEANRQFYEHPVWKKIRCSPEEFFAAITKHIQTLIFSQKKWEKTYEKAREKYHLQAEKLNQDKNKMNLSILNSLKI